MAPIRGALKQHQCPGFISTQPNPKLLLASSSSGHKQVLCQPCLCATEVDSCAPPGELLGKGWQQGIKGEQRSSLCLVVALTGVSHGERVSPAPERLKQGKASPGPRSSFGLDEQDKERGGSSMGSRERPSHAIQSCAESLLVPGGL